MQPRSMMRAAVVACALVSAASVACTGNPPPGDSSYKTGSLGNGGFVFACSDGVACNLFSTGYAKDFPKDGVALGSTFNIYYVPKDDQSQPALNTPTDALGVTVKGLAPFFVGGTGGITATEREGFGAIVAQDANGVVADFISLEIVKPDALTIYSAADSTAKDAQDIGQTFSLKVGDTHQFRAVAKRGGAILAGSLNSEWQSSDPSVFDVATSGGVATLTAFKAGNATLTLVSAKFTRTLAVTVTQ